MTDVAEASGLSKAALYRYFDTKESLFLEVEAARLGEWLHGARRRARPAEAAGESRKRWARSSPIRWWLGPGSRGCSGSST